MSAEGHLATMQNQDSDGTTHTYIILNNSNDIATETMQLEAVPMATAASEDSATATETPAAAEAVPPKKTPGRERVVWHCHSGTVLGGV